MKLVIVGGGSWGTAFARVLQNREHDVTLACRDPEQARAIAETGRNPRYLTHCNLRGVKATTIEEAPLAEADADRSRRAERRLRRGRRVARRRRAGPVADEGARPGDGRAALDARAAAGRSRCSRGRTSRTRSLATCPAAAVIASEDEQLALELQAAISSITFRVYVSDDLVGVELCAAAKNVIAFGDRRCGRSPARRQRQGGARRPRPRRDGAPGGSRRRQAGHVRWPRRHGRPRRHLLVEVRPQPGGRAS